MSRNKHTITLWNVLKQVRLESFRTPLVKPLTRCILLLIFLTLIYETLNVKVRRDHLNRSQLYTLEVSYKMAQHSYRTVV